MSVDLSNYQPIIIDDFTSGINFRHGDDGPGIWSPRTDDSYVTNDAKSQTFWGNPFLKDLDGNPLGVNPYTVQNGVVSIQPGVIPDSKIDDIAALTAGDPVAQQQIADGKLRWYSGVLSLDQTWSETHGYFETRIKAPEGIGHLTDMWLKNTTLGSTPELDIVEIAGRQNGMPDPISYGGRDNEVNANVIYDIYGTGADYNKPIYPLDTHNDLGVDADGNPIYHPVTPTDYTVEAFPRAGNRYVFKDTIDANASYGLKPFDDFVTYGAEWTKDRITFYIGSDHDHLVKWFETETPADFSTPLSLLLWDRIGGPYAGDPTPADEAFAFSHSFDIDYVKVYAENPDTVIKADLDDKYIYGTKASEQITGNALDNVIFSSGGLDNIKGGAGADDFYLLNGTGNIILEDFNPAEGDRVVLEGLIIGTPEEALATLTQVNGDVFLINGRDGTDNAQTIIFRNMQVSDFSAADFIVNAPEGHRPEYVDNPQTLVGNDFVGTAGNDYLHAQATPVGGSSDVTADHVIGGLGDDTYFLDALTSVVEAPDAGVDAVFLVSPAYGDTYVLPDNVEIATIQKPTLTIALIGNDEGNRLFGNDNGSLFDGKGGDDFIRIGGGANTVDYTYGDGFDVIVQFGSDDTLHIKSSKFVDFADFLSHVVVTTRDTIIEFDNGENIILRDTKMPVTEANFVIDYAPKNLNLVGDDNANLLQGGAGDDTIFGRAGKDTIEGNDGADSLRGEAGADTIDGGNGNDNIGGGNDNDSLIGGAGNDSLLGNESVDTLRGGDGVDTLRGGGNADLLFGDAGNDIVRGEDGNDIAYGGDGNDRVSGSVGADMLFGDAGNDALNGEQGNDTLAGGTGNDTLNGNTGTDVAVFDGLLSDYDFVRVSKSQILVTDTFGLNGKDTALGIETFVFDDATVAANDLPF